jgi:predicted transcriptional regulator
MAKSLTDDQVRQAKQLGLAGVKPVRIARAFGCNVETIRRYLRGESRAGIVVEGEESARPPGLDLPTETSADVSLATLQALLNQTAAPAITKETFPCPSELTETDALPATPNSVSGNFLD